MMQFARLGDHRFPMFDGNFAALVPALHGGMTCVVEGARELSDPAKLVDDFRMGFHTPDVRAQRTNVNDENGQLVAHKRTMAEMSVGERLQALRNRSGMTMDAVAQGMGMKGRSSVQRFFAAHTDSISISDAFKLAGVFEGKGSPPIKREEVMAVVDLPSEIIPNREPAPRYMDIKRDVPVYGTAMGTFREADEGEEIEQTFLDYETIDFFERPPGYAGKLIYGFYIAGQSMEPRWDAGDPGYADPKRPPQIGDDVVVYLVRPDGNDGDGLEAVLIKRLIKQSASFIELEQFNPPMTFTVERKKVKAMHRVIPRRELLTRG